MTFLDVLHASPTLTLSFAALFGMLVGSFLNVVILRWPERLMWQWSQEARSHLGLPEEVEPAPDNLTTKASRCPHCRHDLSWWENIPVVSFILLRGKCRSCKTPISWQYPVVEVLGAVVAVSAVLAFGPTGHALAVAAAGLVLLALAGIDARTMLLPDLLVFILMWAGLLLSAMGAPWAIAPADAIAGAAAGYMSLWTLFWAFKIIRGKEGMGYGDFKLLAALGAWCGPKALLSILVLSTITGAIAGIITMIRGADKATPYPFGPFLAVAGFIEMCRPGWLWRLLGT